MLGTVADLDTPPFFGIGRHMLVEWSRFIFSMSNECAGDSKPFSLYLYGKGLAFVALMPMRQVAECLKRHLQLVIALGKEIFPNGQRCIVYPAVNGMIGG